MPVQFSVPMCMAVVASSSAGKSTAVRYICDNRHSLFQKPVKYVFWHYKRMNDSVPEGDGKYVFSYEGIPNLEILNSQREEGEYALLVLDDLNLELTSSRPMLKFLANLATVEAHHSKLAIIYLAHSFFDVPKIVRLNCNYFLLLRSNTDKQVIKTMLMQMFGSDEWRGAYEAWSDAVGKAYGMLLIDNTIHADRRFRLLTDISAENPIAYIPRIQ